MMLQLWINRTKVYKINGNSQKYIDIMVFVSNWSKLIGLKKYFIRFGYRRSVHYWKMWWLIGCVINAATMTGNFYALLSPFKILALFDWCNQYKIICMLGFIESVSSSALQRTGTHLHQLSQTIRHYFMIHTLPVPEVSNIKTRYSNILLNSHILEISET